jgi:hypothetical protein
MKKKILIFCCVCLCTSPAWSQSIGPSTINTAGGSAIISGNTHEFSIGELLVKTATGTNIIVTQGVLQPVHQTTGIEDRDFFADHLNIFPNPAEEVVFLQPSFSSGGKLSCHLYDALGRSIEQAEFTLLTGKEKQTIRLKHLAAGTYMLNIGFLQKGKTYTTAYKIQKLQ